MIMGMMVMVVVRRRMLSMETSVVDTTGTWRSCILCRVMVGFRFLNEGVGILVECYEYSCGIMSGLMAVTDNLRGRLMMVDFCLCQDKVMLQPQSTDLLAVSRHCDTFGDPISASHLPSLISEVPSSQHQIASCHHQKPSMSSSMSKADFLAPAT